jgi:hypothetical protein
MGENGNTCEILVRKPDRNCLKDLGIEGCIISKRIFRETGWKGADWIHLPQARNRWQAFMNKLINL